MSDNNSAGQPVDRLARTRSVTGLILVILASLGVVVSLVGGWVRSTLFDTDSFMEVVEPSLGSEEVITVLGDAIAERVVVAIDLEGRLETRLAAVDAYLTESLVDALGLPPATEALLERSDLPRLANLAGALAAPIEGQIVSAVDALVGSDGFQEGLPAAIAYAHRGAVTLIRHEPDELANVAIVDGEVRWNILPLVESAIGQVIGEGLLEGVLEPIELPGATYVGLQEDAVDRLGEALATSLPDDFGQITVMSAESLEGWQSIARSLDRIAYLAIAATVVLVGVALWVSPKKRRTLIQFAAGVVVALVAVGIVQRNVLQALDEAIPGPPEQAAVDVLFDAVLSDLRSISLVFMTIAVVIGLSAHVAGRPKWVRALRERQAPDSGSVLQRARAAIPYHRDALVAGGIGVALLVWWWLGVSLATLLIVGFILGAYLWYLYRVPTRNPADSTRRADAAE